MYIGLMYDILSSCAYVAPFHIDALCYIHVMLCYNVTLPYSALWGVTEWYQSRGYRELGGLA
jgi:hypothetical protein